MRVQKIRVWFYAREDESGILEKADFDTWEEAENWMWYNHSWAEEFSMKPVMVDKEENPV